MMCPIIKKNEGTADRVIRIAVGVAAVVYGIKDTGAWQMAAFGVGALAMVTGLIGFCPLYMLLGIRTTTKRTSVPHTR